MFFGDTTRNDLLKLYFNATAIANIADNAASAPLTNLYFGLHSAWPGSAGNQTTSEISYTGYARVAVARTSGGFTVTANAVSPVATVAFGQCTAGSATAMFATIGTASSGTGKIIGIATIGGASQIASAATSDTITAYTHGLTTDDRLVFYPGYNVTLPTGITEGTVYFIRATGLTSDAFTISTTSGGAAVDVTGAAGAIFQKVTPVAITSAPATTPQLTTATVFRVF
jgi:hypothetical protein